MLMLYYVEHKRQASARVQGRHRYVRPSEQLYKTRRQWRWSHTWYHDVTSQIASKQSKRFFLIWPPLGRRPGKILEFALQIQIFPGLRPRGGQIIHFCSCWILCVFCSKTLCQTVQTVPLSGFESKLQSTASPNLTRDSLVGAPAVKCIGMLHIIKKRKTLFLKG